MNDSHREQQMKQAEDILGDRLDMVSFAKGLFFGQFHHERLLPYPDLHQNSTVTELVRRVEQFCRTSIDPVAIDRQAEIPASVIRGLGELGVLGACLPNYCGGLGLGQVDYCRLLEVLGGWCGSTALFVNAHHSIGPRAVVLFGTQEQKQRWLPRLATGQSLSAFALTEPEAGSDAANVQTTATPTEDGRGYLLNGQKRWITNGGIAQVLTVMARTPAENDTTKITAFLITPDMPGFEVVEQRMEKCGVRGTATSRLAFRNMFVPKENVLGQLGKGLRIALTVLDYGRTTFGASCTGAAKFCLQRAAHHANTRVQFDETLGSFELVKEKLAFMQAGAFAMEACTYQTAALMDSGEGDFMLETAMLKVFTTETLWRIINDTFQIHGGKAYFTDEPFERMLRDARINTIGEGANDVLRVFSAAVGMRDVGLHLESVLEAIKYPLGNFGRLGRFIGRKIGSILAPPEVPVRSTELEPEAVRLAKTIAKFGRQVEWLLRVHQREIVDKQYLLGRIADVAIDLYASACVINRLDFLLRDSHLDDVTQRFQLATGRYFLQTAERRIQHNLRGLRDNDDQATTDLANRVLQMA